MALLLIVEVIVFYAWLKLTTKNTIQIDKYLWGIFSKKDAVELNKNQTLFAQIIYVTRMSVIFFGIMQILSMLLLNQVRLT